MAERQRHAVERLVEYVKELDGTEIEIIPFGAEIGDKYAAQHRAIRIACEAFKGQPFFWLEPDAIPLQPQWLPQLEKEYRERGNLFLLPNRVGLCATDAACGVGIYPSNAIDIIPEKKPNFPILAWDQWLYIMKSNLITFTRKIQHSYGVYENGELKRQHSFPLDKHILRPKALIFHSDPGQTLIPAKPAKQIGVNPMMVQPRL
jgi:hypothetical protein